MRSGRATRFAVRPSSAKPTSTTVIDPGWEGEVLSGGELLLTDRGAPATVDIATESDPVMLEVFNNQFAGIAEQMGVTLRNTATSVNVKERLDFSCAIFTARRRPGRQRAPHSRSISGRWARRSGKSWPRTPRFGPATCSSPTIPTAAARICPT